MDDELEIKLTADLKQVYEAYITAGNETIKLKNKISKISAFKLTDKDYNSIIGMYKKLNDKQLELAKYAFTAKEKIKLAELRNEKIHQDRLTLSTKARIAKQLSEEKLKNDKLARLNRTKLENIKHNNKLELENTRFTNRMIIDSTRARINAVNKAVRANREPSSPTGGNTSFLHKINTTAQYSAAAAGIYAFANALRDAASASIQFDSSIYKMTAVLGDTNKLFEDNIKLSEQATSSLHAYTTVIGGSFKDIDNAALTLGRAGIAMSEVVEATKVTSELAMITGDSLEDSSKVVSSFTLAFKLSSDEIRTLGNELTYAANKSKLSIADLGTMANYALAGADAIGMTKEQILGMSTALSNMGVNASTIGTQIRKFGKLLRDDSKANTSFFHIMGLSQKEVLRNMEKNSAKALPELIKRIKSMSSEGYKEASSGLEILTKQFTDSMRLVGDNVLKHTDNIVAGGDKLRDLSEKMSMSIEKTWEKSRNLFLWTQQEVVKNMFDSIFDRTSIQNYKEDMDELRANIFAFAGAMKVIGQTLKISFSGVALVIDGMVLGIVKAQEFIAKYDSKLPSLDRDKKLKEYEFAKQVVIEARKRYDLSVKNAKVDVDSLNGQAEYSKELEKNYQLALKKNVVLKKEEELVNGMNEVAAREAAKTKKEEEANLNKLEATRTSLEDIYESEFMEEYNLQLEKQNKAFKEQIILREKIANTKQSLEDIYESEFMEEYNDALVKQNKEFEKKFALKNSSKSFFNGWTDTVTSTFMDGIQDAFDGTYSFDKLSRGLSDSLGTAMIESSINSMAQKSTDGDSSTSIVSGDWSSIVIGLALKGITSQLDRYDKTHAELNEAIDGLRVATKNLADSLKGAGSSLAESFQGFSDLQKNLDTAYSNFGGFDPNLMQKFTDAEYSLSFIHNYAATLEDAGLDFTGVATWFNDAYSDVFGLGKKTSGSDEAREKLRLATVQAELAIVNWTQGIIDSSDKLNDFGKNFGDLYDKLSDTTTYSDKRGIEAYQRVEDKLSVIQAEKFKVRNPNFNLQDTLATLADKFSIYDIQKFRKDLASDKESDEYKNAFKDATDMLGGLGVSGEEAINMFDDITVAVEYQNKLNSATRDLVNSMKDLSDSISDTIDSLSGNITGSNLQGNLIDVFWSDKSRISELMSAGSLSASQQEEVAKLVAKVQETSTSIQSSVIGDNAYITGELVNELSQLQSSLNFEDTIMKVNIVESQIPFSNAGIVNSPALNYNSSNVVGNTSEVSVNAGSGNIGQLIGEIQMFRNDNASYQESLIKIQTSLLRLEEQREYA